MINNKVILLVIFLVSESLISCKKENLYLIDSPSNFSEIFETFWKKMNMNYMYWDVDKTKWDNIYLNYKPLFEKLNLSNHDDVIQSVQYFTDMTKDLIDGHYYISFFDPSISNSLIFPALSRKRNMSNFRYPYHYYNIDLKYLDSNYSIGFDNNNIVNGEPLCTLSGTIHNEILFFSCTAFTLLKSYNSKTTNGVQLTLQYLFNILKDPPSNIKGIIIDVRGNLGGDLGDLNFFVGNFIDKPLHFGYTQSKGSNGRLDYTPWINAYINPEVENRAIKLPIIVLADMNSASLSESVVMSIRLLPNSIFIGETTWGATGPITDEDVYNAGSFEIPNFLKVQTSSCKFKYMDGKIYEGIGFPPDIHIPYNLNEINQGKDSQLEKAINILLNKEI